MNNEMNVVFDKEVDFKIKVSDTDGCDNDGNKLFGKGVVSKKYRSKG